MVPHSTVSLVALLCFTNVLLCDAMTGMVHKRFEYKLSFKGPHLVQRDGTVPFWEHGGAAIASDESVRITPSLRSKKGFIWSKIKNTFEHWELEVVFKVNGRGRIGADGLAIWYTAEKGVEGPVFGGSDNWNGLGVFFDSFDNDGQHNNPYVMVMTNDGTKSYDHASDGQHQQIGGCLRDYRNKPYPIRAKIEYYQNALTLFVHNGMTNNPQDFELCMRAENIHLPSSGHFGVTAATGGLADDHDVLSFLTHSLSVPSDKPAVGEVSEEERRKFEQEFDEYHQKLEKAKEDYRKEHPDKQREDFEEGEKYFESQDVRELKMIFDGQNQIHQTMRMLHQRLDEVIGRQERTLSQISSLQVGNVNMGQPAQGHQGQAQLPMDSIKRFEVDTLLNTQRELQSNLKNIQNIVSELSRKSGSQGGAVGGYDGTSHYQDLKSMMDNVQREVRAISNKPQVAAKCPEVKEANCVTTSYLVMFLILQIVIFIGYSIYRSNKDASAKKFY